MDVFFATLGLLFIAVLLSEVVREWIVPEERRHRERKEAWRNRRR